MTCINNQNNFPCILQQRPNWCIPASIENVMKYHRSATNITQSQIVRLYTQHHPFNTISFQSISQVLRINYSNQWDFDPRQWPNNNQFTNYIESVVNEKSPVIISMNLARTGAHMFVVLCINTRYFRIFDPGYLPTLIDVKRDFILSHLAPRRGTLLINPI